MLQRVIEQTSELDSKMGRMLSICCCNLNIAVFEVFIKPMGDYCQYFTCHVNLVINYVIIHIIKYLFRSSAVYSSVFGLFLILHNSNLKNYCLMDASPCPVDL